MLYTYSKHLESIADNNKAIRENENAMIVCGRMGHIYYKNGRMLKTTSSIQTKDEVISILNKEFSAQVTA
jgi:hypothetical protein